MRRQCDRNRSWQPVRNDWQRVGPHVPARAGHAPAGFSLVELLIAMTISGLLFAGITQILMNTQEGYATRQQTAAMQQRVRDGLDFLVRELTMAGLDPTESGVPGMVTATASTIPPWPTFESETKRHSRRSTAT